ncbi:MAG: hypothetical protein ACLRNQ_17270 [Flavonifractor plautii]
MANPRVNENLVIENARLLFRNFSGRRASTTALDSGTSASTSKMPQTPRS